MSARFTAALALCLVLGSAQIADAKREKLVYGISERPFPAILHADYPLARASAWIAALQRGCKLLPSSADLRLRRTGLNPGLASLACAALYFPIDVVTPENSQSKQIRVFLKFPPKPQIALDKIFSDSYLLLLEMSLIKETQDIITELRLIWPDSSPAPSHSPGIEKLSRELSSLWVARDLIELTLFGGSPLWGPAFKSIPESVAIRLALSMESQDISQAEGITHLLLRLEADQKDTLWTQLAARALYQRGKSHERLHQPGLAEADYSAALARMVKAGNDDEFTARLYISRADLRGQRDNYDAMCKDYIAGCALGSCQGLSNARLRGYCTEEMQ